MDLLADAVEIVIVSFLVLLCADFLSGLMHWLEDTYGDPSWPVIGPLVTQANVLHHFDPRHMTHHSWIASAKAPFALACTGLAILYFAGVLSWPLWLLAAIAANSNEIHKWAHRSKAENGQLISFIQKTGLLQSRAHHARHHQHLKNTHYCVVTNYLNPILEATHFWRLLEGAIYLLTGARQRLDPSTTAERHSYPVPPCRDPRCRTLLVDGRAPQT